MAAGMTRTTERAEGMGGGEGDDGTPSFPGIGKPHARSNEQGGLTQRPHPNHTDTSVVLAAIPFASKRFRDNEQRVAQMRDDSADAKDAARASRLTTRSN